MDETLYEIYRPGDIVNTKMTLETIRAFDAPSYSYYDEPSTNYLYKCVNNVGDVFTWFTSKFIDMGKGSEIKVHGKVKQVQNYRGQDQVVLTRVKMEPITVKDDAETMWKHEQDEYKAQREIDKETKKREQRRSIRPNDIVIRVKYKEYKNKYPKAETVIDSYDASDSTIELIIRSDGPYIDML